MRRLGLAVFFLLICAASALGTWTALEIRHPYRGYAGQQIFVDIPGGASRHAIARRLAKAGVVPNWLPFEIYSLWHRRHPLEAGEYLFDRAQTPREVFWKIASGRVYVRTITIPEGWTMFDIAAALQREGIASRDDFLAATREGTLIHDLAPHATTLEGYLFPATYEFTRQQTAQDMATAMVAKFRKEWTALEVATPAGNYPPNNSGGTASRTTGPSTEDIVTMASLIERETPQAQERALVASVFYNRLAQGLPLQCDPTVQYALLLAGWPTRELTQRDLQVNSPYNTYMHTGLPPGPIANPGLAALQAALFPARTNYLYFVANVEGGHFFSSTLAEHQRNVAIYHRRLAGETDMAPAAPTHHRKHRGQG